MKTAVRIYWKDLDEQRRVQGAYWNEVCAWCIEYFGLPGERFFTETNTDHMDFIFNNEKDALLMSLRWNAHLLKPS